MKYLFSLSLFLFAVSLSAQDTYLFKPKQKPNSKYVTSMEMESAMEQEGGPASMPAGGMTMSMQMTTKTGDMADDGKVPFTMTYDKMEMNSPELPRGIPGMSDMIEDIVIYGFVEDGHKIKVDSMIGLDDNPMMKQTLNQTVEQMTQSIEFPNEPMAIGDTFEQDASSTLQAQMPNAKMIIKYTLMSVEADIANFDYEITMSGEMMGQMTMTGTGTGTSTYDLDKEYVTSSGGDTDMIMNMKAGDQEIKMITSVKQNMTITLEQ